jgi:hypothetical protein
MMLNERTMRKMKMISKMAILLMVSCASLNAKVNDIVKQDGGRGDFRLVYDKAAACIYYEPNDYKVVEIAVNQLSEDIAKVTGVTPVVCTELGKAGDRVVVVGTIGRSETIDRWIKEGRIDSTGVANQWETYALQVVDHPQESIESALVIFGSDRRGTAYGVFELSSQIGVSPWYWWADVPVAKKKNLVVKGGSYRDGPPSVKYRGIFINDEDWGLKPWASEVFDPELGDIGPKTYKKVFELLLRLKANHCWPAMHECTRPFNYYPDNKKIADDYAIVMGSAHCEPLLFNNATEWDVNTMGDWRYDTNREKVYEVLDKRVSENGRFENVYTVGMRGIHDRGLRGNLKLEDQIVLLEQVFADQRKILATHIDKRIEEIPQVFIPYKEVMTLYNNGLRVPEDVTLMWVDDNFGYIRRLSDPLERQRSGGAGVYYHLSYLGPPHEYLWLCTTPPALIWEEMKKAYDFNARRVWVANIGDIKPAEYGMSFFLDLAWDINIVDHASITSHLSRWLGDIFGHRNSDGITAVMKEYYELAFERKPEFMSFGDEFSFYHWPELWKDTEYSFVNYREAEIRLERYRTLSDKAADLYEQMPDDLKPAYFELVYYPVVASSHMNHKLLLAQKNRWHAEQQRSGANDIAQKVKSHYEAIKNLTDQYDQLLDGKWKHMMSWRQNKHSVYYLMPPLETIQAPQRAQMGVLVEGNAPQKGIDDIQMLPCFNSIYDRSYFIEIYNRGKTPFEFNAVPSEKWIKLTQSKSMIDKQRRIFVSIDWSLAPKSETFGGQVQIKGAGSEETVFVNCFNPIAPARSALKGLFVEDAGVISISAENYSRKVDSAGIKWGIIDGLGLTGKSVVMEPSTASELYTASPDSPRLEYDIHTFNSGIVEVHSYMLPVFAINSFRKAQYAISLDGHRPQIVDISVPEYSGQWKDNVRRNASKNVTRHYIDKPGKHTLKIWAVDTGMAIDKVIIDLGGLRMSYVGPGETRSE